MEDDLTWLAAGLVFVGIIIQHDARASMAPPEPLMQIAQREQAGPQAPFPEPLKQ